MVIKDNKVKEQKPIEQELNIYDHLAIKTKFSIGDEVFIKYGKFKDCKSSIRDVRIQNKLMTDISGQQYPVNMILYQLTSDTNIEILRSWFPEECLEKLKKWVFF